MTSKPQSQSPASGELLRDNQLATEIYAWLTFRMPVGKPTRPIAWPLLMTQFGSEGTQETLAEFRERFLVALQLVQSTSSLDVEVVEAGLSLRPSTDVDAAHPGD